MHDASACSLVARPDGRRWHRHAALWVLLCLAAGCGQKGPLTLPASAKAASAPSAP